MRAVICFSVFLCAVVCQDLKELASLPKYDDRYDYLDVDAIFTNKRLIRNYVNCLINSTRCTPEGKALKRLLPEALRTKCVRCTERQKRTAVKIISRLKYEYPEEWAKLEARWDPTGDFTRYFEEFLAKEQFNTISGSENVVPLLVASQPRPVATAPAPSPAPVPRPMPVPSAAPVPRPMPVPEPGPALTNPPVPQQPVTPPPPPVMFTSQRPAILNRFGGDGELMMGSPSSAGGAMRPTVMTTTTTRPTMRPALQPRPTPLTWAAVPSTLATRFPLRPTSDLPPPYSTAITLIDQIGYKIIRTTEIVTDLLRNTVRAVVG